MPIGEIEICKADFTDLNIPVSQGDYYLKPLFYPGRKNNSMDRIMVEIMQTCIEYFFSFPEIKQLVSTANANDKESNELLLQCGFQFEEQIRTLYDLSNYYWCTRNSFRNSYTF